jgi:hypothetical protein
MIQLDDFGPSVTAYHTVAAQVVLEVVIIVAILDVAAVHEDAFERAALVDGIVDVVSTLRATQGATERAVGGIEVGIGYHTNHLIYNQVLKR